MSIEVSIVPESDSANSVPQKIAIWEEGNYIYMELEYPLRRLSFSKDDLQKVIQFYPIEKNDHTQSARAASKDS